MMPIFVIMQVVLIGVSNFISINVHFHIIYIYVGIFFIFIDYYIIMHANTLIVLQLVRVYILFFGIVFWGVTIFLILYPIWLLYYYIFSLLCYVFMYIFGDIIFFLYYYFYNGCF